VGAKAGQQSGSAGRQRLGLVLFGAIFVLLFIGFAIAQGIGAPSVPSGDVAMVEEVPDSVAHISQEEFDRALAQQVAQAKLKKAPSTGSEKWKELRDAALGELLDLIWIQGTAEEMGLAVTDKQIEDELANIKKQSFPTEAKYQKFLKESGFSDEDVRDRVKLQVLSTQIQEFVNSQAPKPSESEVQAYYEAEKSKQFTTEQSRDIRAVINTDKKKVEEAKAALEADNSPASWKKVVSKYSAEPGNAKNGGLQKGITEKFLEGPLKEAIFGSAKGEVVGPIKLEENWVVLEVVELNPEKVQQLAEVKAQIQSTLGQEQQQEFFAEFVTGYQSKWISRTICAPGYEVEQRCSNFKASHPANASPACYEADPKTPAKECPSPVTPISPALPGSVTEQKPKGEPFPQRPIPESATKEQGEVVSEEPAGGEAGAEAGGE
jgi:foldase protein PrsA